MHKPSHACQRRKIDELAYALSDERRGRTRSYLRYVSVRDTDGHAPVLHPEAYAIARMSTTQDR